jgi:hypothetical protein
MKRGWIIGSTIGCIIGLLSGVVYGLAHESPALDFVGIAVFGGIIWGLIFGLAGWLIGAICTAVSRRLSPARLPAADADLLPAARAVPARARSSAWKLVCRCLIWGTFGCLVLGCGTCGLSIYLFPRPIYVDIYVDNATGQTVRVEFDEADWGLVGNGSYQKFSGRPMQRGPHTLVIRAADSGAILEQRTETFEDAGPWVLNVLGAQTYLRVSDFDLHGKKTFDNRQGHQQRWFKLDAGGFTRAADSPEYFFHYYPNSNRLLRWSQIPDARRAKPQSKGSDTR